MMPTLAAMLLAIDVGNTNIVVGVFDGERLIADFRIHTDDRFTGDELGLALVDLLGHRDLKPEQITAVVVCSVVPTLARSIEDLSHTYFKQTPMVVGPGTRTGIRIQYDDPRRVGADRIANAIAAHHLYQGPAVLVDFGTATTFDAIDARGDYMGGAIAPGIQVSHDALVTHAAMLSRIELTAPPEAIGRSTTTSMQSGMVYGYVGLVEGLVERFRREIPGQAKVIATGGLAAQLATLMPSIDIVDERLTLHGLRLIYDQNR
jgi:type III pantothenate kinase